tara:strand:- start:143 stop:772 length:630 start_codon:yes stop_codon:yes gene_type:complete
MALFPDHAARKARLQQSQIMFNQLSLGNKFHNKEAESEKAKDHAWDLFNKNYSENVFNAKLQIQGKVFKGQEDMARRLATSSKVNEGGRSKRYGDNIGLMAASKISQLEHMAHKVGGEMASANIYSGAIQLRSRLAKTNVGPGVPAKMGVTYTPRNQFLSAVKLAAQIGTGDFGGAFGELESGGNASMFQWMGGKHNTGSDLFGRGGVG